MASPLALALMQGQSASGVPQPNRASVNPTNITQATADYNNAMEQSYQAQLQQQNAMWGGLAGLGSAGILAGGKYLSSPGAASSGGASLFGNAGGGTAASPLAGLTADDYGAGASLFDQFGLGTGAAAADAGAATDAAAAGGGSDALASLLALFA
jgi:hypothetical protein